jgi:hypothetical protein
MWLVITLTMLRIASWVSGELLLIHAYGWERVAREHLQLKRLKPLLVVSNGDVLPSSPFLHYLIGVAIWMPSAILLWLLAWKLLPPPYHQAMKGSTYAGWSLLLVVFLFFALNLLPLRLAFILAVVVLLVAMGTAQATSQRGV